MSNVLSNKDSKRRQFVLEGNIWEVVLSISIPLAIYNGFNHLFVLFDSLMASHIGSEVVSAVAYLSQIKNTVTAIGAGLSVGGGIIIARYYGAGDIENAKKNVNTLFFLATSIGLILLVTIVPFTKPILRLLNTPEELISVGSSYFAIEIIMIVAIFINNVYIAVEKAKGNTKKILHLNLMVLGVKLTLTALFVYVLNYGITMMAVATLLAHLLLTVIGISSMLKSDNVFRLSFKSVDLSKKIIWPIINLAIPIFFEKFAFSFGKMIVNSMSTLYHSMVVGALGISNNISGITTSITNGFQDGETSIISQNLGNKNPERALDAFKKTLIVSVFIGFIGFLLTGVFMDSIVGLFAKGDIKFAKEIKDIYKYERYALIGFTIASSVLGLLYGLGYTRLSLAINFIRLFLFRIPTLYFLQRFTNVGSKSVGIAMLVSNGSIGVISVIVCFIVIQKMKTNEERSYLIIHAEQN